MRLKNPEKIALALSLLMKSKPMYIIREILKKQFGSAMSNSDLVELRGNYFPGYSMDMKNLNNYKKYFGMLYNFIYELRYRVETESDFDLKKFDKYLNDALDIKKLDAIYKKYKEKERFIDILESLPEDLKNDNIWLKKFKESIKDYKNNRIITFEDYMKE
ncbi:MAG: hypothetical protein ACTSWY_08750 [Promethearchaeota archaeon]